MEPEIPTLVQFMEHLFRFELRGGARTGMESVDFSYVEESEESMDVDQGEAAAAPPEAPEVEAAAPLLRNIDVATKICMECIMVEVVKQEEAEDPGKFLMELKDLKVLPVQSCSREGHQSRTVQNRGQKEDCDQRRHNAGQSSNHLSGQGGPS